MPLPFISQPIKIASELLQAKGRREANRQMEQLMREQPVYQVSPMLGLAQTQLQGRMAGASQAERNIYQQGANAQANINRAATDPMQAILGAGAIQGQTSQAFNQLAGQEQADYANRLSNLTNISAQERANQFEDELRRFGNKAQLQSMIQENKQINRAMPANLAQQMTDENMKGIQAVMGLTGGGLLGGAAGKGAAGTTAATTVAPTQYSTNNFQGMGATSKLSRFGTTPNWRAAWEEAQLPEQQFDLGNMGLYGGYRNR